MNKNLTAAFALLTLFASCKSFKYSMNQEIKDHISCERFDLVSNRIVIKTELEGKPQELMLDLGASTSVIYDTSMIPAYSQRSYSSFGGAKGAAGKKIKIKQIPLAFNDSLFSSTNKVFTVLENVPIHNSPCGPAVTSGALYGADFFKSTKALVSLDFEQKQLCCLDAQNFAAKILEGYTELNARFKPAGIHITITINGKDFSFVFDTGYNGSITMPYSEDLSFQAEPHVSVEGIQGATVEGKITGLSDYYEQKKISLGNNESQVLLTVSHSLKAQNIGIGFIKTYNWLIDYNNKKIYSKPNNQVSTTKFEQQVKYLATMLDGKIIMAARNINNTEYGIGDEIISVKGQTVNIENRCELLKMLNSNSDWKVLEVRTKNGLN